jgi:hypothetical protein
VNVDNEQMRTNIHASSGMETHDLGVQAIEAYASDHATTGTIKLLIIKTGKAHSYH